MEMPAGETESINLRVGFNCRLKLESHGLWVIFDAGLFTFRKLDDVISLTEMAGRVLGDIRTGKNGSCTLTA